MVATPIGNLEDLTLRALRVLREADAILAEDTRQTKKLCARHGVATPLRAFHAHTPDPKVDAIVEELAAGAHLALVTDAGTPLVSDPGARLVERASDAGVSVVPIPGPSAPLAALAACGLRVASFRFVGFLPRTGAKRRAALEELVASPDATVIFEAPPRLPRLLTDLRDALGPARRAAVCRELTKLHEEIARGSLEELAARYAEAPRGEITVVVEGAGEVAPAPVDLEALAQEIRTRVGAGERTKDVAKELAKAHGLSVREVYALAIEA